ncbi:hypothetical protein BGW80DRAFT_1325523 [Lactifluus volemus]|nr:hypothetical protein BGW80DRAFT_1325523 [Lactifluus volemus]
MSLNNINDPEGVKALLESLRTSPAWADALKSSLTAHPITQAPTQGRQPSDSFRGVPAPGPGDAGSSSINSPSSIAGNPSHTGPSVADLLSQLRASHTPEFTSNADEGGGLLSRSPPLPSHDHVDTSSASQPVTAHASSPQQQDLRTLSFQQALPHISRLMEDPLVVKELTKMKQEQDKLEKQLWEEREAIRKSHEEKVKVAKTKATMIGVGLSKHDAESMSDTFRTELRKFDAQRVLPAWDGLVREQQSRLEALKVPTMFVTDDADDAEKQLRVMHVLEGILPTTGPDQ